MSRDNAPEDGLSPSGPQALSAPGIAEAERLAAPTLRRALVLTIARIALRLGFCGAAAIAVGRLVMDGEAGMWPFAALVLLAAAQAAGWLAERSIAGGEAQVADDLRRLALRRVEAAPARAVQAKSAGEAVVALQRYPQSVAALALGHRIATLMMAVGPLCAAAALVLASWQAALLLVVLTPLMIVFFALVGDMIRSRARAQEQALGRLAGQFADRIRALPTIVANHAVDTETAKLEQRQHAYADNTMRVLRIAFLNAGVIDFFSSLSIAMLAVFLGLGHLKLAAIPGFHDLELWQSLFILMIAPDYFAPFRRYAEQYHAKAEGLAAAAALDRLLAFGEAGAPVAAQAFDWPQRGLVAITGPSGAGKTTLLRRLAGVDSDEEDPAIDWISTESFVPEGTLADAIGWSTADRAALHAAAASVGLLDDTLLPGGLDAPIGAGGENLSGGQRLRIAVARAALSDNSVVADEPTAKLDTANAKLVRAALQRFAATRPVIVATHDEALAALADRRIALAPQEAQP